MPVAKSYQNLETIGEHFEENGKNYIKVRTKAGLEKVVRWYTLYEYKRMYPNEKIDKTLDPYYKPLRVVLGFVDGYIYLCGNTDFEQKDWFHENGAKYNRFFGWYFTSDAEIPEELPEGVTLTRLDWDMVSLDEDTLKPEDQVQEIVWSLTCEPDPSEYVGEIGERLELYLTVDAAIPLEGYYGRSTLYSMHDDCGNVFVWTTSSAKNLQVHEEYHLRGTVKAHKQYKQTKQTILTRCTLCS